MFIIGLFYVFLEKKTSKAEFSLSPTPKVSNLDFVHVIQNNYI